MKNDIKEKLSAELRKELSTEAQVVYILSRIRKILEIDQKEKKEEWRGIKFYCDWALHSQIDNTDAIKEYWIENASMQKKNDFVLLEHFDEEFRKFLREYSIPESGYNKSQIQFKKLLIQIYSDTPLIIKTSSRKKVVISTPKIDPPYNAFGVSVMVVDDN